MYSESAAAGDIAVIGIAVRFPEADDLGQFLANLRSGRDSVRELSTERKWRTSLPLEDAYQLLGYIEDIDSFDHAFFGVAKAEADTMAPHHRMLLQTSYQAVENAGYSHAALRGLRGSVYIADTKVLYDELAAGFDPTMVMGSHASATAGRLSRFFGLRGPAAMIDTACSSALVAAHMAVNDLITGDAQLALVGCASLNLFADRLTGEPDIGIRSADGKTRCFSADAAGTGSGEAVATLVLKRLDDARRDGDHVHAVIKSVAVNHVGGRSSTLTAPDSEAEAEVIEHAWAKAGIDPRTVTYIEAHGTATRLGDPIEIEAIDTAFARHTGDRHFCALSSAKSNLGHTWSASGLVGLVKAVLSLQHHELYPNLHSAQLSPLIDFENSATVVTRELTAWDPDSGVRRAGVSSFGVMGTNAHAVLEEAPPRDPAPDSAPGYWLPVSAKSPGSLAANVAALRDWIEEHPDLSLADVQRTLVDGRTHYPHRFCAAAYDLDELRAALDHAVNATSGIPALGAGTDPGVTVLVVSGDGAASGELTDALRAEHPRFDELYRQGEQAAHDPADPRAAQFAFQYAFIGLLRQIGLTFAHVVGEGTGKLVVDAEYGRLPLDEAVRRACAEPAEDRSGDFAARVDRLLGRFEGQRVRFVEAGPLAAVTRAIAERALPGHRALAPADQDDGLAHLLRGLYLDGADWTWAETAGPGRRIELPSYQFERTRCWLSDVRTATPSAPARPADGDRSPAGQAGGGPVDTLSAVVAVYAAVLGVDTVPEDDSYFSLGGDSISGLDVVDRLNGRFGTDLDIISLIDNETPRDLAAYIDSLRPAGPEPTPATVPAVTATATAPAAASTAEPVTDPAPFPASAAQLQIWLAAQFEGGSVAFNLTRSFRLDSPADPAALQAAVTALTTRHEALRARFTFQDGQLRQSIAPAGQLTAQIETIDLDRPAPDEAALALISRPFAAQPFDLETGPLLRAQLVRFHGDQAMLTVSTHHIVADGWSLEILVRDLAALYAAQVQPATAPPAPLALGYRAFQLQQQPAADRRAGAEQYWLERFADAPGRLDLPTRPDGAETAFRGSYRTYGLPGPLWARLKQFSRDEGGTAFGSLLSVFAALFAPYAEQGDLVLGTSLAGRTTQHSDQVVGMLVRTIPIRVAATPDTSLRGLYAGVRSALRDGMANLAYPYEELVQELRRRSVTPASDLFDVLIEFEQFGGISHDPFEPMARAGVAVTPVEVTLETSVFPLNIMLSEQPDGLAAVIRFDTRLFDEPTVDRLWAAFTDLTDILLAAPGEPMGALPLLGPAEQERLRTHGHRDLEFDRTATVQHAIERHAAERPDRVCLSGLDGERTYRQLNARANQLARHLREHCGVQPGDLVALVMDRSVLTVETILAVWKCGAAYLPVDPNHPAAFVRRMLDSAAPRAVAFDPRQAPAGLVDDLGPDLASLAITAQTAADEPDHDLGGRPPAPDALAYVIFTSGSTGEPKGAMVEHLGMLNHLHAKITDLALTEHSTVAQNASNSFDISVWQMFAALVVGGHTVVYEQPLQLDPVRFAGRLAQDRVTVLEVVPSYLDALLEAWRSLDRPVRLDALEYLMVTGEAVHPRTIERWFDAYPGVPVVNAYGPTEASDDVTHHIMTEPVRTPTVPLGLPIPNTFVYLLDEYSRVVPPGARGEICVSGICVGRGYLNAPDQTRRVFTTDPFDPARRMYRTGDTGRWNPDGTLQYLGRSDAQVKVRGFRVDLGEIERRVLQAPGVEAAAVVVPEGAKDRLCAYVVLAGAGSADAVRAHLAEDLPDFMVPSDLVDLPELPLTTNGKIDRVALRRRGAPARAAAAADDDPPASLSEQVVWQVWEDVLGQPVSRHDRFFDVGGNSLRAIQVLSRLRVRLGAELRLEQLFTRPTVAALAALVSDAAGAGEQALPSLGGPGRYELAPTQHLLIRVEQVASQRDAFNRNDRYEVHGPLDPDLLQRSFAAVAQRHETLRTTFETQGEHTTQVVHAPGDLPPLLRVHDLRSKGAGRNGADPADAVTAFVRTRIRHPFDITREPLVRADLLRTGDQGYTLLTSMHQLVSDGRSAQVLHDDLLSAYDDLAAGRDPSATPAPVQYKDYAHWRTTRLTPEAAEAHRRFWAAELDGATPSLPLPTDRPRPQTSALDGRRLYHDLPDEVAAGVTALARECAVTEFVVVRTALALALYAWTGQPDATVGTYTRGRNRADIEDGIGFYINTVPLRLTLPSDGDVRSLLAQAQRAVLRAFEHEDYPYEWTMNDLGWKRGPDRAPLFDVMVALDDWEEDPDQPHTIRLDAVDLPRRSKEGDLLVAFGKTAGRLQLVLTYDTHLFAAERAQRFASSLSDVLASMTGHCSIAEILKQGQL
ncbi:MAG TPA: amino acid adenylation domain-containing protein [Actinocrinis sp.]|nr:amino acid adenylation domain-containing protein [Actinocrinis sp.]